MDPTSTPTLAVLGPFALRVGDRDVVGLPRKAQALIAFLALQPDRRVPREVAAELLWTRSGPEQARHSLRQMLVVLRRSRAGDLVKSNADALWIEPGSVTVDTLALEAALTEADVAKLSHYASQSPAGLLDDFPAVSPGFDDWLRPERARLAGVMARVLRRLVTERLAAGDFDAAVASAAGLVELDTLDEAAHRLLIECLARAGRRGEAMQQFETCVHILRAELDVAPDVETAALADRIRAGGWPANVVNVTAPGDDAPAERPDEAATPSAAVIPAWTAPIPARRSRWLRRGLVWAAVVVAIAAGSAGVFALRQPGSRPPGLLVAELRNAAAVPHYADAIAGVGDLLRFNLATRQHLRLIEDPAGDGKLTAAARDRARRDAGARYVLDGTVLFEAGAFRITIRLTDARTGAELWASRDDSPESDLWHQAEDIAVHVARAVAQDREIADASPRSPFVDPHRAASELIALGHLIDYFNLEMNPASRQIYRLATRYDDGNVDALAQLANTYVRAAFASGLWDPAAVEEADAILHHAMQLDPANIPVLFNSCLVRRAQGRIAEGIELCRRTLDIDPRYPGALRELGNLLLRSGEAERAIPMYQASIDAARWLPFVPTSLKGLGIASLVLGRRDDAIKYFRQSVERDETNLESGQLWLAAVLEMDGQYAEATAQMKPFMARHPGLTMDAASLELLSAPAYADWRDRVLAAMASAAANVVRPDTVR